MAKRTSMRGMGADAFFTDQHNGKTVSQDTGRPVPQLIKATFYLTPDLVMKLEEVRIERLRRGQRIDKSALVREAIEQLAS
jgi:hypothetical protein